MYRLNLTHSLPDGYAFVPSDEVLLSRYLYPKIKRRLPLELAKTIPDCDLYAKEPWMVWEEFHGDMLSELGEYLYFFTLRKKLNPKSKKSRYVRSVGTGKGTWHGVDSGQEFQIPVGDDMVWEGLKKRYNYENEDLKEQDGGWIMLEYTFSNVDDDLSLCVFRKNNLDSGSHSRKRTLKDGPVKAKKRKFRDRQPVCPHNPTVIAAVPIENSVVMRANNLVEEENRQRELSIIVADNCNNVNEEPNCNAIRSCDEEMAANNWVVEENRQEFHVDNSKITYEEPYDMGIRSCDEGCHAVGYVDPPKVAEDFGAVTRSDWNDPALLFDVDDILSFLNDPKSDNINDCEVDQVWKADCVDATQFDLDVDRFGSHNINGCEVDQVWSAECVSATQFDLDCARFGMML